MNTLGQRSLLHIFSLLATLLLLTACWGDAPAPTPTPTATAPAAAPPVPSPTTAPTVAPAPSSTPTVVTQSVVTNAVASAVTTDRPISATQPVTGSQANTATANINCSQEADLDVAGYPDLKAKLGCPLAAANFDPVGINEFGPGPDFDRFMLWFGNELKIYVLLPNKQWQAYDDTWREGDPTFTCNPSKEKAKSPPLPRRGFNKIWCTVPNLPETMGTIVVEERQCQHSVVQRFERGRLLACYENATIRYIRLLDDGTWDTLLTR